jgi:hypothetical protein
MFRLFTGSFDKTVKIWTPDGQIMHKFDGFRWVGTNHIYVRLYGFNCKTCVWVLVILRNYMNLLEVSQRKLAINFTFWWKSFKTFLINFKIIWSIEIFFFLWCSSVITGLVYVRPAKTIYNVFLIWTQLSRLAG